MQRRNERNVIVLLLESIVFLKSLCDGNQWLVSLLSSTNCYTSYVFTVSGKPICALYARQIARQCDIVLERYEVAVLTSSWGKTWYWFRFRLLYSALFTLLQLLFVLLVAVIERLCDSKSECVCVFTTFPEANAIYFFHASDSAEREWEYDARFKNNFER